MPTYAEALAALPAFRNELLRPGESLRPLADALRARGAYAAFAGPASNVHAIGVGLRRDGVSYAPGVALKIFVFDAADGGGAGDWNGLPVDVEHLPVQLALAAEPAPERLAVDDLEPAQAAVPPNQRRVRPVVGGVSVSPLGAPYVGTLGCLLRRPRPEGDELLALSNNHVLADTNALPRGTPIVQPGPERGVTLGRGDVFATLADVIPIRFPGGTGPEVNRFDAAVALVSDPALAAGGAMVDPDVAYDPSRVRAPLPGMRVVKVGRTTGTTRGVVTAVAVDGVQVNYGTPQVPRLATFDDTVEIVGDSVVFSRPGDSGSVILEEATGHPVALLFAGDGEHTTACDFGRLCRRLGAWPV